MTTLRRRIEAYLEGRPVADLADRVADLMTAYRDAGEPPDLSSPDAVAAYVAYRMPGTHAAGSSSLSAAAAAIPELAPVSAFDLGGGTGALAWAMAETFPTLRHIRVVDGSRPALRAGRELAASGAPRAVAGAAWEAADLRRPLSGEPVDLLTAGYVLGELDPTGRERLVGLMTATAGTVLVVEPGTPAGFERVRAARHGFIAAGMRVAAPCPHDAPCPMAGDWCHFAVRFERSSLLRRLKGGEHGHDDEKFSYVVATRLAVAPAANRIIRHPRYRKGLVGLDLCTVDRGLLPVSISKRSGETYRRAREAGWGDPWE